MNYDKVRDYNYNEMKTITQSAIETDYIIKPNLVPAKNALDELEKIKKDSGKLFENIESLKFSLYEINEKLRNLEDDQTMCDQIEQNIKKLEFKIEKKKKEVSQEQKKVQTICQDMMNYEETDKYGDGLIGKYYNNENWLGTYFERKDGWIDFDWTGSPPFGLNPLNFSVLWEGYIYAPISTDYSFTVISNNGVELYVNDKLVVSNRIGLFVGHNHFPNQKSLSIDNTMQNSEKVYLSASELTKIKIKYFRSSHLDINNNGLINIKILWSNAEIKNFRFLRRYLYSSNDFNQLKITNYNTNDSTLNKLYENGLAFKNTDKYIIQDIPPQFIGLTQMRKMSRDQKDIINFEINAPSIVYIAFLAHYPKFLPEEFENTGYEMSLLEFDRSIKQRVEKRMFAKKSAKLLIYQKTYDKGIVNIHFKKFGINTKGIPMIIFFGFDSKLNRQLECNGARSMITSDHEEFLSCIY